MFEVCLEVVGIDDSRAGFFGIGVLGRQGKGDLSNYSKSSLSLAV